MKRNGCNASIHNISILISLLWDEHIFSSCLRVAISSHHDLILELRFLFVGPEGTILVASDYL